MVSPAHEIVSAQGTTSTLVPRLPTAEWILFAAIQTVASCSTTSHRSSVPVMRTRSPLSESGQGRHLPDITFMAPDLCVSGSSHSTRFLASRQAARHVADQRRSPGTNELSLKRLFKCARPKRDRCRTTTTEGSDKDPNPFHHIATYSLVIRPVKHGRQHRAQAGPNKGADT